MAGNPDYIDFPCSDAWLDHYHARGLTPRSSERRRQTAEIAALRREVAGLREALGEVVSLVQNRRPRSAPVPQEQPRKEESTETRGRRRKGPEFHGGVQLP